MDPGWDLYFGNDCICYVSVETEKFDDPIIIDMSNGDLREYWHIFVSDPMLLVMWQAEALNS